MNVSTEPSLLIDVLKGVSRSFYLSMRVLPRALRAPVGVAYLLARAADTLADTSAAAPDVRIALLHRFRACLFGEGDKAQIKTIQAALSDQLTHEKERELLQRLPEVFALLDTLSSDDRQLIVSVVETLTDGMCFDLETFPSETAGKVIALNVDDELDQYTYWVAGCVGEFWTRQSYLHVPTLNQCYMQTSIEQGVQFGKALQLTNILRDLPRDLRIGRCYLPNDALTSAGLTPEMLMSPENSQQAHFLLVQYMQLALDYYASAEAYVLTIPASYRRLRLAALWPSLIGLATLGCLSRSECWLDPQVTIKVERRWVYRMIWRSLWQVGNDQKLKAWFAELRNGVILR